MPEETNQEDNIDGSDVEVQNEKANENEIPPEINEYQALEHKYKLALADYQNLFRQNAKDRRDSIIYANEQLIRELLPVYDNLKLSLKHSRDKETEAWFIGIEHVIQQFKKVLQEAGLTEINTQKLKFNPEQMEAVEKRETDDKKLDQMVAEELTSGYLLNEKVIVPARVAVYSLKEKS